MRRQQAVHFENLNHAWDGLPHGRSRDKVFGRDNRSIVADASPLFRIPANELIDAAADQGAPWSDWACYMRERYMLATVGSTE